MERYDAGLVLTGTEIKSLRQGKGSIAEAYVRPLQGELWLVGANIALYEAGNRFNHEPTRDRKLLLHRREIRELTEAFEQRSLTIVPTHLYLSRGLAKVQIAVGRGRKRYDKRAPDLPARRGPTDARGRPALSPARPLPRGCAISRYNRKTGTKGLDSGLITRSCVPRRRTLVNQRQH